MSTRVREWVSTNSSKIFGLRCLVHFSQLDSLALEHDINSLRRECEQKDVTIKELSTFLKSSEGLGSKVIFFTALAVLRLIFLPLFIITFLQFPEDGRVGRYHPQEEYDYQQASKGHNNSGTKGQDPC